MRFRGEVGVVVVGLASAAISLVVLGMVIGVLLGR